MSRKLQFGAYKRIRYAFLGIFALDVLSGLFLCTLYRHCVPGYEYDYSIILATGIIIVLEWALYSAVRRLVYRKIPFFYEEPLLDDVTEVGINTGIEHTELLENRDVTLLLRLVHEAENSSELLRRMQEHPLLLYQLLHGERGTHCLPLYHSGHPPREDNAAESGGH